jgi:hypothetical protein
MKVRSRAAVLREYPQFKKLFGALFRRLQRSDIIDIYNYGAGNGVPGFTYYSETLRFYKKYQKEIIELAENLAFDLGEDMLQMIGNFKCLKSYKLRPYDVALGLDGKGDYSTEIQNAMVWFALEEFSQQVIED